MTLSINSRLSRSFTARGSVKGGPTKGISESLSSLRLAAVLRSGEAHENNFYIAQVILQNVSEGDKKIISQFLSD